MSLHERRARRERIGQHGYAGGDRKDRTRGVRVHGWDWFPTDGCCSGPTGDTCRVSFKEFRNAKVAKFEVAF